MLDIRLNQANIRRFFRDYLPLLPILDPQTHPDTCYAQSPFLFWAIVATGSRRYTGDPTLFGCLSSKVINLAFSHLASRAPFVQAIQALLLLITWGSSEHLSNKDLTFPLSGLLVHMSMQIGLHNPLSSQDFAKTRIRLSDEEVRRRNELWAHCIILYQRYLIHHPLFPSHSCVHAPPGPASVPVKRL